MPIFVVHPGDHHHSWAYIPVIPGRFFVLYKDSQTPVLGVLGLDIGIFITADNRTRKANQRTLKRNINPEGRQNGRRDKQIGGRRTNGRGTILAFDPTAGNFHRTYCHGILPSY
jgi:hypothetical protein